MKLSGRAHACLRPYGFNSNFWEKLGEIFIDVVLVQEAVRDLPGAGQAWVVLAACLVDQLRAGFDQAKDPHPKYSLGQCPIQHDFYHEDFSHEDFSHFHIEDDEHIYVNFPVKNVSFLFLNEYLKKNVKNHLISRILNMLIQLNNSSFRKWTALGVPIPILPKITQNTNHPRPHISTLPDSSPKSPSLHWIVEGLLSP